MFAGINWGKDKETLSKTYKKVGPQSLKIKIWCITKQAQGCLESCNRLPQHVAHRPPLLWNKHNASKRTLRHAMKTVSACNNQARPPKSLWLKPSPTCKSQAKRAAQNKICSRKASLDSRQHLWQHQLWTLTQIPGVVATINNQQHNKVLCEPAPEINTTEKNSPPRQNKIPLAQLRRGYASGLNSYLHGINPTTNPTDIQLPWFQAEPT